MFKRFAGENHNSVGEPTYRWVLEAVFETWREEEQYFPSTEAFKNHYKKVEATYGTSFNIPYTVLGNTHYMLQDNPTELAKFQAELKTNYPNAFATFSIYRANQILEKQPQESEKLATKVLKANPNSFESLHVLAKVKLAENKSALADSLIDKAMVKATLQKARQW